MKKVKSKRVVSMLVALSLLSALAGCGEAKPETPAEITDAMHTAMTATPCTSMKMDFVLDMSVSSEETGTMLLGMDMSSEGTVSSDPVASHSVVTTLLDLEGQPVETTAETYTVVEDDTLVTYALTSGIWTRVETGVAVDALTAASAIELDSANVSIDEAVTEWNGIPAVCLVTTMSGAEMPGHSGHA